MSEAFGAPGIEPRWTHGDKEGVGTTYSTSSRIWFTIWKGIVTEIYYPHVDTPQTRDVQILITDGKTFFHEEKKLENKTFRLNDFSAGYRVESGPGDLSYSITKEIITDPHSSTVLIHYKILPGKVKELKIYLLCAPHLGSEGMHNNGEILKVNGSVIPYAYRGDIHMAVQSSCGFSRGSAGFVAYSDGWTDIFRNLNMDYEFTSATDGNIALTAELPQQDQYDFTIAVAFGDSRNNAILKAMQAASTPFSTKMERFNEQWGRSRRQLLDLGKYSTDKGNLFQSSYNVLVSHEDKTYAGALIASLSIPWGEMAGDENKGGYHLVWVRDMYHSSTAAMAAGDMGIAENALIFLATSQQEDGGFPQNFWLTGEPYWRGIQLDETAFAIILAWRVAKTGKCAFDPHEMVMKAASFIVKHAPVTDQERWEEASGYSPSTLASNIAAMVCASEFALGRGENKLSDLFLDYADFLWSHLEQWTVTNNGTLVPDIRRHFIRILPSTPEDSDKVPEMESALLTIANHAPDENNKFKASEIVDGGFLELVRYGIMKADDPLIIDSVKVIDAVLKVKTKYGETWHRYNHDGYGETEDGFPYTGHGKGRAWPLLAGERGHYEIALGKDPKARITAMEKFSSTCAMLSEQVWDSDDIPERHLFNGRHTGSARPLAWAHAEYIKLLRSVRDQRVFDLIDPVYNRYCKHEGNPSKVEIWRFNRKITEASRDFRIIILAHNVFSLHAGTDGWDNPVDIRSEAIAHSFYTVEVPDYMMKSKEINFTFFWPEAERWEGRDFVISLH